MKRILYFSLFLLFCFSACTNEGKQESPAENGVDAVRDFIRLTMDGDYNKARTVMLPDSQNTAWLQVYERYYNERMKPDEKQGYKSASINIHEAKPLNDSTRIITYSITYPRKDTHQLKSIRVNGKWLVDLKYYFESKNDSIP